MPDQMHITMIMKWSPSAKRAMSLAGEIAELADLVPDWNALERDEILGRIKDLIKRDVKVEKDNDDG